MRPILYSIGLIFGLLPCLASAQQDTDPLRELQFQAVESKQADWAHWGDRAGTYSTWTNHSNRLIPVFGWGVKFNSVRGKNSVYRDAEKLKSLYGYLPEETVNPEAKYFDQTDVYKINHRLFKQGKKKHIILMVFDGMDWQTLQAAANYRNHKVAYKGWRGTGLAFQDYREQSAFGFYVTSPHNGDTQYDVNAQVVTSPGAERLGGYNAQFGGATPWALPGDPSYLLGKRNTLRHAYTDSAASATSLNAGIKTYNGAINVTPDGKPVVPLARQMQQAGFGIGVVTSVPISHATPAAVYSNNVTRNDYQDLTRDLLGIPSISNRTGLPGVDVLIGCGWGEEREDEREKQGLNYIPGNKYLAEPDLKSIDVAHGGKYIVAQRTAGKSGPDVLAEAAQQAVAGKHRLFGFFGTTGGHLPYQTADGKYDPTRGVSAAERYSEQDLAENPTLAQMTAAALQVLQENETGFYLMIEPGDVDWANHNNNIDDSIGAVFSGEAAFEEVVKWVEANSNWDETALILTADHGHMLVIDNHAALTGKLKPMDRETFRTSLKKATASETEAGGE